MSIHRNGKYLSTFQHCFRCGGINHFHAQCPLQENSQWLFQGRGITESAAKHKHCSYCWKEHLQSKLDFWQCGGCNVVHFCDKVCQKKFWENIKCFVVLFIPSHKIRKYTIKSFCKPFEAKANIKKRKFSWETLHY